MIRPTPSTFRFRDPLVLLAGLCSLAAGVLTGGTLHAQTIFVVDAAGGPGAQFTDIQPAIDAASDGDRILVRAGAYSGFVIRGKGLAVLGEANARLVNDGQIHIAGTGVDQDVVLTDLLVQARPPFLQPHGVTGCRGRILFERIQLEPGAATLTFTDCRDVRLSEFRSDVGIGAVDSTITVTDSQLLGGVLTLQPPPGLELRRSRATLSRCNVAGQSQFNRAGPSVAIRMDAATVLTITDDGSHAIASGTSQIGPLFGIAGGGTVIRDPRVTILGGSGGAPISPGITEVVTWIPSLRVIGAPVGANVELDLSGLPGAPYAVLFGLPTPGFELLGIDGTIGVTSVFASFVGVFGANPVRRSYGVGSGLPPGVELCWQAISVDGNAALRVSNASTYARTR